MGMSHIGQAVGQVADTLGGQVVGGDRRLVETGQTVEVGQAVETGGAGGDRQVEGQVVGEDRSQAR